MAKRKISVEEFTNDVLAGMSDSELMKKYRISRKTLDGMLAKLLQRGELRPADLADPGQKPLEPTLELAVTCPQCGALNLFGSAQCPECGQSRVTRHFQSMDTQESKPVPADTQTDIKIDTRADNQIDIQAEAPKQDEPPLEDKIILDREKDPGTYEEKEKAESPGHTDAVWETEQLPSPQESPPATAPQRPRSRKAFLYIAVAALLLLAGAVGVGVYTQTISLPFGKATPPPTAVHKPTPGPKPVGPPSKKVTVTTPSPLAVRSKPVPSEPTKEPSPAPAAEKSPIPPPAVAKSEPPVTPPKPTLEEARKPPVEREKPEPPITEAKKPAPVQISEVLPPGKLTEPGRRPSPVQEPTPKMATPEAAPKVAIPEPAKEPEKPSPEKTPRLALVPPVKEPTLKPPVERPSPKRSAEAKPPDAAPPFGERSGLMPSTEGPVVKQPEPHLQRHASMAPTSRAPREPSAPVERDMAALLIEAVSNRDPDMTKVLLDGGADPNSADSEGTTALMYAASTRCLACVDALLKRGADVRRTDKRGNTALDLARRAGRTRAAELILAHDPEKGPAALFIACREGLTDILRVLVENGVDVNSTDRDGNTALMVASEKGNLEMVSILLKKGADVRARNNQGQTALTVLSRAGSSRRRVSSRVRKELVRMLGERTGPEDRPLQQNR